MNLNSNGKLAKFYMWFPPKDGKLPSDLCTYFWGLVGRAAFIFFFGGTVLFWLIQLLIFIARTVWANKLISLSIVGGLLLMGFCFWLGRKLRGVKLEPEIITEAKAIVANRVDGIKSRYCPRIDWVKK